MVLLPSLLLLLWILAAWRAARPIYLNLNHNLDLYSLAIQYARYKNSLNLPLSFCGVVEKLYLCGDVGIDFASIWGKVKSSMLSWRIRKMNKNSDIKISELPENVSEEHCNISWHVNHFLAYFLIRCVPPRSCISTRHIFLTNLTRSTPFAIGLPIMSRYVSICKTR